MRVAVLTSTPGNPTEGSGTFVATHGLVRGLVDLGLDVHVRPLGARTGVHTFDRLRYNLEAARRPPRADVVLGIDLDGFLWARRRPRPPFVASLKGVIADEMTHERGWVRVLLGIQARWEGANARCADRLVAPSAYSARVASALYGVPETRFTIIPEPVDLAGWRARLAAATPRDTGRPTVLAVARMYPRKRIADLIDAAALLRARIPDIAVRIVGKGPEFANVARRRAERGLERTVDLLGDVTAKELAVEYASAHLFCLPTVQEAFGIVFAEAMAAGLPVVACAAGAVPEVVEHGRTGLLVEPRRPDQIASALERLLMDRNARKELGAAGMQRVEAFDVPGIARRWLPVLTA